MLTQLPQLGCPLRDFEVFFGGVCCKCNGIEGPKTWESEKGDVVKTYPLVKVIRMCIMGACIYGLFIETRMGNGGR